MRLLIFILIIDLLGSQIGCTNSGNKDRPASGPSGASFHQDGPGNVDHIMWVTMMDNGPQMGNIALKGIFNRMGLDTTMFGAYDRKGY